MRFATFVHEGMVRSGVVTQEGIHPLGDAISLLELIRSGRDELMDRGRQAAAQTPALDPADVRLLPPFEPPTVRDFMTFERHVEGTTKGFGATIPQQWYAEPVFYFTNPHSMIGAHDDVPVPPGCRVFDFELEVAAVVGAEGRDLTPERAREHIIGYTLFNDWSARDIQGREMRAMLGPSKGKDSASTLGPWLVTADELEPHRNAEGFFDLELTAAVNGKEVGRDTLANMAWTFEELVSHASRGTVVRPGDVLGSGTCGNGGCLAELWGRNGKKDPPALQPGDTVTLTAEGIGTVSNTVVPSVEPAPVPVRPARRRS